MDKAKLIKKDFTKEQVHELMGEPDGYPYSGRYAESYNVDENIRVIVSYFTDGIDVAIINDNNEIIWSLGNSDI